MIKEYQLRKLQNSYEVTLNYKGVKVRVAFTGGNVYNSTMPKLRTNDLFKMKAIEASELFRNKEVVLVRIIAEGGDAKRPVVQQRKVAVKPVVKTTGTKTFAGKAAGTTVIRQAQEPEAVAADQEKAGEDGEKKVFDNLGDAIMFVAQNYQVSVQSESEVRKVLKEHGVKATIKKG